MTYEEFYDTLAALSIEGPTFEICKLALDLQVALDNLDNQQIQELAELF